MQTSYYFLFSTRIVKNSLLLAFMLLLSTVFLTSNLNAQTLLDNYDGAGDLTYTTEGTWAITGGLYEGQTGSLTTPEHSYAAYDLSLIFSTYNLNKANADSWFGWIDLNRTSVGGWGATSYSAGMILAANSSDFNDAATNGYAVVFNSNESLDLIKFDAGITDGTAALPGTSTILASSGYTYADGDNGVNFFVEYLVDGTWKISYLAGAKLSDVNAIDKNSYTGGNATSSAEETYTGSTYKYAGWVYAHGSTATQSYFDNFGADHTDNLPPAATWDPADAEIGVPINGDVTISFDESIRNTDNSDITDPTSLITFETPSSGGTTVSFTSSINAERTQIAITPSSQAASTNYYVALADVEDANNNLLTGENITYTTIGPEPTNHALINAPSGITHKDITNTWLDNDAGQVATGFLLMINRNGTFIDPVDGVVLTDDTDVSDGDGHVSIAHGVETYTWRNLDSGQGYSFVIYAYYGSGDNINYKTTVTVPNTTATTSAAPNPNSTIIEADNPIPLGTINSITNAEGGSAKEVFRFTVVDTVSNDYPDHDSYSTYVTNVRVRPNRTNTVNWSDHIQSVELYNNRTASPVSISSTNISDTLIDISILKPNLEIQDNDSVSVTLAIYLKASNTLDDGGVLSFYIDDEAHGFVADEYGSTFTTDPLTAEVISNDFTIEVDATKLIFNNVPSNINESDDFTVEVWATDSNGNLDIDDLSGVTLSENGSGDLNASSQTQQNLINGSYIWNDVQYNTTGSFDLSITDTDGTLPNLSSPTASPITSYATGVATPGSISISEFMADPATTSALDVNGEWIELYNSNTFIVNIDGWTILDDGSDTHTISNGGTLDIAASSFLVLGLSNTTTDNGNYNPNYVYSGVELANTADEIILKNGATEISRVNYDTGNGWTITEGSSLIFTGTASDDNNDATFWTTSTIRENGYLGTSNTDKGSPGTNGYMQNLVDTTTWIGTGSWSTGNLPTSEASGNYWNNGYPGTSTNVAVNGTLTILTDTLAYSNNLTISTGNTLTVSAGKALTVHGNLANNNGSASGLYLDADATSVSSLITNGTISGDATVISYFTDISKYYIISPPISNALGAIFTGDVVYAYNEPAYTWDNPTNLDYAFGVGIGYAIYKNSGTTVTYSGSLNTGTIAKTLSYTYDAAHTNPIDGWNLMGNPYPSVLDASYFDYTDISNGVWVNLHNSASDYYVYWSKTLGTVGSSGEGGGDDRARYIQPGQGFWIYTDVDGTAFNLSNSMRTHQNQGVFSKSAEANTDTLDEILKISVSGNDIVDPAYILFRSNASLDFDRDYDLLKMTSTSATVPHIFSLTAEEYPQKLAINAIDKPLSETVVPLGLKIGTDGTYSLYFDGMNSFEESQDFYLRDRLNGELFDIRQQPMIEFTHSTSNDEHRFDLVMGLQTDINNSLGISLPVEVYSSRNTLYIRPGVNQEVILVEVKNLLGQTVYSNTFNDSFKTGVQLNLPSAFYLVDIKLKSGNYSKKIFIQNLN